jgi:hypothetical protein
VERVGAYGPLGIASLEDKIVQRAVVEVAAHAWNGSPNVMRLHGLFSRSCFCLPAAARQSAVRPVGREL